jgi:hypothetical protein
VLLGEVQFIGCEQVPVAAELRIGGERIEAQELLDDVQMPPDVGGQTVLPEERHAQIAVDQHSSARLPPAPPQLRRKIRFDDCEDDSGSIRSPGADFHNSGRVVTPGVSLEARGISAEDLLCPRKRCLQGVPWGARQEQHCDQMDDRSRHIWFTPGAGLPCGCL